MHSCLNLIEDSFPSGPARARWNPVRSFRTFFALSPCFPLFRQNLARILLFSINPEPYERKRPDSDDLTRQQTRPPRDKGKIPATG